MQRININLGGVTFQSAFTSDSKDMKNLDKKQKVVFELLDKANELFMANDFIGCVTTFKNGNAYVDGGINIIDTDGVVHNYLAFPVYMSDNKVFDKIHGYDGTDVYEYMRMLSDNNPKLRIDLTMSQGTPWDSKISYWLNKYSKRR